MVEGNQLVCAVAGISTHAQKVLGADFWAMGYLKVSSCTITDGMIQDYIDEQEGEQIADDSRFLIDSP